MDKEKLIRFYENYGEYVGKLATIENEVFFERNRFEELKRDAQAYMINDGLSEMKVHEYMLMCYFDKEYEC